MSTADEINGAADPPSLNHEIQIEFKKVKIEDEDNSVKSPEIIEETKKEEPPVEVKSKIAEETRNSINMMTYSQVLRVDNIETSKVEKQPSNERPVTPTSALKGRTASFRTPSNMHLANASGGIEDDSGSDDEGRNKKGKRKERSHSRIVLHHKKNLLGETIFKGHPSWVLMLNIQTGIRNEVGKSMHQSRTLVHSRSQPNASVAGNATPSPTLNPSNSQPISTTTQNNPKSPEIQSPIQSPPPILKYTDSSVMGPEQFAKLHEFYASPGVLQFPKAGSQNTIPHTTGPFKFKDYCPHAFRYLRHRFGIDQADYMVSLCNTQKNGENALRELPTPGKSGSLFFFSHDMRFILKTIPKDEAKLLRYLLPYYVEHIANNENTLLPKFFGLHRVKPHKGRQVRFVVMGNVFHTRKKIHERFDLKGSTLGRAASEEEKKKDTVTYKDLDFRERQMKLRLGEQRRADLLDQLQRDTKFLGQLNIMDYSFLIGVHYTEREDGDRSAPPSPLSPSKSGNKVPGMEDPFHSIFQTNDGGMRAMDENGGGLGVYYYMGVIDILMLYSARKKIEHAYKTLRYKKEGEEISSVSPDEYATRFYQFMASSIV